MPLLLIDLDDSLIDRRAGFRAWAGDFCIRNDLGDAVAWLEDLDELGYAPREAIFERVRDRFGLAPSVVELVADYRERYPTYAPPPSEVAFGLLHALRAARWKIGVVTNGSPTQLRKIEAAGLSDVIDTCCVSEIEGVRKPDPAIFRLAAERCGRPLDGAWMAGDNPETDIGGAHALGLSTIWFRHGRDWPEATYAPTLAVDSLEAALVHLAGLP